MATGIGSGLSAQLGIETETTFGVPVAVTRFLEIDSESLGLNKTVAQGQGLHGAVTRRAARRVLVSRMAGGDFTFDLPANGMGKFVQHMMGSYSTTAVVISGAAFKQIHNQGSLQGKSFTTQTGAPDITGYIHPFTYPGCKVSAWELTAAQGAMVKCKLTVDAMDEVTESQAVTPTTLAASAIATATSISTVASIPTGTYIGIDNGSLIEYVTTGVPSGAGPFTIPITSPASGLKFAHASGAIVGMSPNVYNSFAKIQTAVYGATTGLLSFKDAHLVVGGTTSQVSGLWTNTGGLAMSPANGVIVRNVSVKGATPLKTDRVGAGSQVKAEPLENNFRDITGSLDIEMPSRMYYDLYQTDQSIALVLNFQNLDGQIGATGQFPTFQVYLPAIKLEDGPSPDASGPDIIIQKVPFTALDDGVNGQIQIYIVSTDATV